MGEEPHMKILVSILSLLFVIACSNYEKPAIDLSSMDKSVPPGEDFYMHVNGNWLENTEIPESESRWGVTSELRDYNKNMLHSILEDLITEEHPEGSDAYKVAQIYKTGMDTAAINQQGIQPLKELFDKIESAGSKQELLKVFAAIKKSGSGAFFTVWVDGDLQQSDIYAVYAWQSGLGMPNRDYYLEKGEKFEKYRTEYSDHLKKMFVLLGDDEGTAQWNTDLVMKLETEIAEASWPQAELRNWPKMYNKRTLEEAGKETPGIDWELFFNTIGVENLDYFIMAQPDFFAKLGKMIQRVELEDWKIYLKWHVINTAAPYLSKEFRDQDFYFFRTVLRGVEEQKPRWKTLVETTDGLMGEALGKLYVAKHFPPAAKERMNELVGNLRKAFRIRIEKLDWMGEETKKTAYAKLDKMTQKLGYPDKWRDYSNLEIEDDAYVLNVMRANVFEFERKMNQIGKPVDKEQWNMSPPTVNAYFHPLNNEIVFPAGILQPPMFNLNADDAVNYGAIGTVIGHEITHGYDDSGSRFNEEGNMINWWSDEDKKNFEEKIKIVEEQFDEYVVLDSVNLNGKLTLGENIADLGGIAIAYDALQMALEKNGRPENIDGYTPEQRFFLSYATIWRNKHRDDALLNQVKTDPHSPAYFRVIGPLSNTPTFFQAFDVKEGDEMRRPDSILAKIW